MKVNYVFPFFHGQKTKFLGHDVKTIILSGPGAYTVHFKGGGARLREANIDKNEVFL